MTFIASGIVHVQYMSRTTSFSMLHCVYCSSKVTLHGV